MSELLSLIACRDSELNRHLDLLTDRLRYDGLELDEIEILVKALYQRLLSVQDPELQEHIIYTLETAYENHRDIAVDITPLEQFMAIKPERLAKRILILALVAQQYTSLFQQAMASESEAIQMVAQELIKKYALAFST